MIFDMIEEELRKNVGGKYSPRELKIAINFYRRGLTDKKPTVDEMLRALRTEYEKGRADAIAEMQKEWSEDDEKRLQSCINILKAKSLMGKVDTANTMWLKSLKQRIGG